VRYEVFRRDQGILAQYYPREVLALVTKVASEIKPTEMKVRERIIGLRNKTDAKGRHSTRRKQLDRRQRERASLCQRGPQPPDALASSLLLEWQVRLLSFRWRVAGGHITILCPFLVVFRNHARDGRHRIADVEIHELHALRVAPSHSYL